MLAIGITLIIGILILVLAVVTDQPTSLTVFIITLTVVMVFMLTSITLIEVPNEPKNLELISSTEVEIVYTQGQYWIYNSNNKDFTPLFDKDLQSYVVYEKGLEYPKVYKEEYKKPNLWYITPLNLNDYTYYKIVVAE